MPRISRPADRIDVKSLMTSTPLAPIFRSSPASRILGLRFLGEADSKAPSLAMVDVAMRASAGQGLQYLGLAWIPTSDDEQPERITIKLVGGCCGQHRIDRVEIAFAANHLRNASCTRSSSRVFGGVFPLLCLLVISNLSAVRFAAAPTIHAATIVFPDG